MGGTEAEKHILRVLANNFSYELIGIRIMHPDLEKRKLGWINSPWVSMYLKT